MFLKHPKSLDTCYKILHKEDVGNDRYKVKLEMYNLGFTGQIYSLKVTQSIKMTKKQYKELINITPFIDKPRIEWWDKVHNEYNR